MVWAFDPRKLIEEEKENEKKKVKEVLSEQEEYDKIVEEQQAKAEKIKSLKKIYIPISFWIENKYKKKEKL